jgi:hypothetical protein
MRLTDLRPSHTCALIRSAIEAHNKAQVKLATFRNKFLKFSPQTKLESSFQTQHKCFIVRFEAKFDSYKLFTML